MSMCAHLEWIRNQKPALVTPSPSITNETKVIWIGKLILETFLVKFLPAPEHFRRKILLGWVWDFYPNSFTGSLDDPERVGELSKRTWMGAKIICELPLQSSSEGFKF